MGMKQDIAQFEQSTIAHSVWQIMNTIVPYVLLWYVAYEALSISYWLTLAVVVVAAGFVIRIFILFHDCCHYSFFKNRSANEIVGTITGILTLFPYHKWRHNHSIHHATSSNLDKRGTGDVWLLTVDEYVAATPWKRVLYRLYRNPIVMFGLGPVHILFIQNRMNRSNAKIKEKFNTYLTNIAIVAVSAALIFLIGWQAFLLIQVPMLLISGAVGIWLFYVQHQFEDSFFENEEQWSYVQAAVEGSSYYKLPKILQWITGNIGFHHVHHLSPRIPNYYLEEAHNHVPALKSVSTVTIRTSLQAIHFRLWDERNKKFVSFQEIKLQLLMAGSMPSFTDRYIDSLFLEEVE